MSFYYVDWMRGTLVCNNCGDLMFSNTLVLCAIHYYMGGGLFWGP